MGMFWSRGPRFPKGTRIVMLGLDGAGKTTLLYKQAMCTRQGTAGVQTTIPTIGFYLETLEYGGANLQTWDLGGQQRFQRRIMPHLLQDTNAVIFVVDATDRHLMEESRQQLEWVLNLDHTQGLPLLVVANKQDKPGAMTEVEVTQALGLAPDSGFVTGRHLRVLGTCAVNGAGFGEGLTWLAQCLSLAGRTTLSL